MALRKPVFVKISDLAPSSTGVNVIVKVVSCNVVVKRRRPDGSELAIGEVLVGDETGVVVMTARNAQLDACQPNATLAVRNGKIDMFKGFMRLSVDKWGKITKEDTEATFTPNASNNVSATEYELVAVNDD